MIELLAPAGSREALTAAVESGADAVYLAGNMFGARAYADNFDEDGMKEAIRFAHLRGVHVHVTVNTIMDSRELPELKKYLRFLHEAGADAVLVQDLGAARIVRETVPPDGYGMTEPMDFAVPEEGGSMTVLVADRPLHVMIRKLGLSSDGVTVLGPVIGAKLRLETEGGEVLYRFRTGEEAEEISMPVTTISRYPSARSPSAWATAVSSGAERTGPRA